MADKKISALTASTTPLSGTEVLPIVQNGVTKKVSVNDLTEGKVVRLEQLQSENSYGRWTIQQATTNNLQSTTTGFGDWKTATLQACAAGANMIWDTVGNTTVGVGNLVIGTSGKGLTTGSAVPLGFGTNNSTSAAILDINGNLGLSVSPSAWNSGYKVIEGPAASGSGSLLFRSDQQETGLVTNGYRDVGGTWRYKASSFSTYYFQQNGQFYWFNAPSGTAGDAINFTQAMGIDVNGNITANTGNLVIGTSGKGIDFSADGQAAGMTSELLDDYEEGTWTPVVTAFAGSITSYTASGTYTKVGRLVTAIFEYNITDNGTGSALILVTLPFTSGAASLYSAGNFAEVVISGVQCYGILSPNSSSIAIQRYDAGYAGGTGAVVRGTVSYQV